MRVLPATLGHEAQGSSCSFRRQLLPGQTQWGGPTISCSSLSQEQWSALASSPDLSPLRKGGCARAEGSWGKERCQVFELGSAPVRARPPFVENSGPYEWLWARVGARGRVRSRISPTPYASPLDAEGMGRGKEGRVSLPRGVALRRFPLARDRNGLGDMCVFIGCR